jgi:hypothetical protein
LEIEGVFPDIDADEIRKKRMLIGGCGYRQSLGFGINALENEIISEVGVDANRLTSQPHPEP